MTDREARIMELLGMIDPAYYDTILTAIKAMSKGADSTPATESREGGKGIAVQDHVPHGA